MMKTIEFSSSSPTRSFARLIGLGLGIALVLGLGLESALAATRSELREQRLNARKSPVQTPSKAAKANGQNELESRSRQVQTETSMRFSGSRVDANSQVPFGASLNGEKDKEVFSLLEFRSEFSDRETDEESRVGAQ